MNKRRVVPIVDARFQWKYTLIVTALGVGVTAVMGWFLYKAHLETSRVLELDSRYQAHVASSDQAFLLALLGGVAAMGVVLALWGLIVTHRISGPLALAAHYLHAVAEGEYPEVRRPRKHDELQAFFATLQAAVDSLKNRDAEYVQALDAALAKAQAGENGGVAIAALQQVRNDLASHLTPTP